MINENILSKIFEQNKINNVIMVEENNYLNFIISNMTSSLSLDKWEYLENILKDVTSKNINIITYNQALKNLGNDYIKKGVVIRWKMATNF